MCCEATYTGSPVCFLKSKTIVTSKKSLKRETDKKCGSKVIGYFLRNVRPMSAA